MYLDVKDCFYGAENAPVIVGGRYGLGSKDTTPSQIIAVFKNLSLPDAEESLTIGIVDDVTSLLFLKKQKSHWAVKVCSKLNSTDWVLTVQ